MVKTDQSLAEFLNSAPLYVATPLSTEPSIYSHGALPMPDVIRRYCDGERCGAELDWYHHEPRGSAEYAPPGVIRGANYACRNCGTIFLVWFSWRMVDGKPVAAKVGQAPALTVRLPRHVEKALGGSADLWKKGIRSRHQGYGIGALAYFRRVVEDSTSKLLELLADAMATAGEPEPKVQAVRDLIAAPVPFATKMEQAAKTIPRSLRPGDANPFQTMFEILSGGLHGDTDAECCRLVDALANSMLLIVARLNADIENQKAYGEAVKDIEGLRTRREND